MPHEISYPCSFAEARRGCRNSRGMLMTRLQEENASVTRQTATKMLFNCTVIIHSLKLRMKVYNWLASCASNYFLYAAVFYSISFHPFVGSYLEKLFLQKIPVNVVFGACTGKAKKKQKKKWFHERGKKKKLI